MYSNPLFPKVTANKTGNRDHVYSVINGGNYTLFIPCDKCQAMSLVRYCLQEKRVKVRYTLTNNNGEYCQFVNKSGAQKHSQRQLTIEKIYNKLQMYLVFNNFLVHHHSDSNNTRVFFNNLTILHNIFIRISKFRNFLTFPCTAGDVSAAICIIIT